MATEGKYVLSLWCDHQDHPIILKGASRASAAEFIGRNEGEAQSNAYLTGWRVYHSGHTHCPSCAKKEFPPQQIGV